MNSSRFEYDINFCSNRNSENTFQGSYTISLDGERPKDRKMRFECIGSTSYGNAGSYFGIKDVEFSCPAAALKVEMSYRVESHNIDGLHTEFDFDAI